jgi:hypothetical protein
MQVLNETLRFEVSCSGSQMKPTTTYINGAFFFCPLTYALYFCFQNLPSYFTLIGKYGPVYIRCHEVVGFH